MHKVPRRRAAEELPILWRAGWLQFAYIRTLPATADRRRGELREAVKAVVDVGYPHNFQIEPPHIREYCYDITKAIEKCFAALAAPPRNCDLPEVAKGQPKLAEQAWRVFKRSHKDSHLDSYGLLRCIRWLLAPATEQEGGAK